MNNESILEVIEKTLEQYDNAVLMEGSIPIMRFDKGLTKEQTAIVLFLYTKKGHTYWIDGYNE